MGKRDRLISEHPVLGMPLIDFFYLWDPSENHRYIEFMWKSFFDEKIVKPQKKKHCMYQNYYFLLIQKLRLIDIMNII